MLEYENFLSDNDVLTAFKQYNPLRWKEPPCVSYILILTYGRACINRIVLFVILVSSQDGITSIRPVGRISICNIVLLTHITLDDFLVIEQARETLITRMII